MLSLPPSVRIFLATEPADMRKSFDGLSALVSGVIDEDPLSGHVFVFFNRRRNRVKILWWDRSGYWLAYKRLERGTFTLPAPRDASTRVRMTATELMMLLEGIDFSRVRRRRAYDDDYETELRASS